MGIVPITLSPGELWIHVGPTVPGFYPVSARRVICAEWEAKQTAVVDQVPVVLELRMSGSALRTAQRGNGTCFMGDLPKDVGQYADVVTTGFFRGRALVIGCLKRRDAPLFLTFTHNPDEVQPTLWDFLLSDL